MLLVSPFNLTSYDLLEFLTFYNMRGVTSQRWNFPKVLFLRELFFREPNFRKFLCTYMSKVIRLIHERLFKHWILYWMGNIIQLFDLEINSNYERKIKEKIRPIYKINLYFVYKSCLQTKAFSFIPNKY